MKNKNLLRREYVWIDKINYWGGCHKLIDGKLWVDEARDGKSTQDHLEGIEYLKNLINDGVKLFPVLLKDNLDGTYEKLDGFKRILAHKKAGCVIIEAFVCSPDDMGQETEYNGLKMRLWGGGQNFKIFTNPVEYGESIEQKNNDGKIDILYSSSNIQIEYRENIHLHFGNKGKYRLCLGQSDFQELCRGVIDGEGC